MQKMLIKESSISDHLAKLKASLMSKVTKIKTRWEKMVIRLGSISATSKTHKVVEGLFQKPYCRVSDPWKLTQLMWVGYRWASRKLFILYLAWNVGWKLKVALVPPYPGWKVPHDHPPSRRHYIEEASVQTQTRVGFIYQHHKEFRRDKFIFTN